MKTRSAVLGEIEYAECDVLQFPEGLLGFEKSNRYLLLELPDQQPFGLLQSIDDEQISFVVVKPELIRTDYTPEFTQDELSILELDGSQDWLMLSIIVLDSDPAKITINLRGPLLINPIKNLGCQVALRDPHYSTKHFVMQELVGSQPK